MRPIRTSRALALSIGIVLSCAAPAAATPATNIQSELQAAGVPAPNVVVATPPAATAADVAAIDVDPSDTPPSITNENSLSPDPTAPLPVATVSFAPGAGTPLAGLLAPPGTTFSLSTTDADVPLWELDAIDAVKHEIARGTSIAGIALKEASATEPYSWIGLPSADRTSIPPATVPAPTVEQQVRTALPPWAAGATVAVSSWTANERRVSVTMTMVPAQLAVNEVQDLVGALLSTQAQLNQTGAGIGSVVARIETSAHVPLVSYAGDADWGTQFLWSHPLAEAWTQDALLGANGTPADAASNELDNTLADPAATPNDLP